MSVLIFFAQFLVGMAALWAMLSAFMFVVLGVFGGGYEYRNLPLPRVALKISKLCAAIVGAFAGLILVIIGAATLIEYLGTLA